MGLMTEAPWEYYQPPPASTSGGNSVDHHRENLRNLKKISQLARMKKEEEANKPMKAFALTEANKKKFDHVQSKVQEWVVNTGRESTVKSFLRGHQKSGPFLEDNDSAIRVKRLSGLKSVSSKDKVQASDYGTMSQSCTSVPSAVPPLNLDDDINDMEIYDTDDPRRDVSLGYLGIGARFSDISIGERKDRINNLISEIYCAAPLSSGNSSRKSLHQSIKRYASVDQVSDVDSVITGTTVVRPLRSESKAKLSRHPSYDKAMVLPASSLRKFASSPKLNFPANIATPSHLNQHSHTSVYNLGGNKPLSRATSKATSMMNLKATSMVNLKAKKNSVEDTFNKHMPLRKNASAPMSESKSNTTPARSQRKVTPPTVESVRENIEAEDQADLQEAAEAYQLRLGNEGLETNVDRVDYANHEDQDDETLTIRGSDVDYVRANIHCATSIGRARRKEVEAAQEAAAEKRKKKSEQMKPSEKYKTGSVPKYLQNRQASWKAEVERIEREKPDPDCPAGHRKLSDGDRREILGQMKERYKSLTLQANSFPVRNDTMRVQKMKAEIEREMANLEEKIRQYERPKVFVKIED